MKTDRKTHSDSEPTSLRQRAKTSRASAVRIARGGDAGPASDPVFAVIGRHRASRQALSDATNPADRTWVAQRGGDTSQAAMQQAEAIWDAADLAETEAWNALFAVPPSTHVGLVALLRHAGSWAEENIGAGGAISVAEIFETLADSAQAVSGLPAYPTACAASRLSELLEKAWILRDRCDEGVTPENGAALSGLEDYAAQKVDDLQTGISFVRANSPAGMLIQLAVASGALNLAVHGSTLAIREAASDRTERCLFSVAAALCAMTGIDREGLAVGRYLSLSCDQLATPSSEAVR